MADYVIGVDIGTGSAKSLALNFDGQIIGSAQVLYPTLHPAPGFCEQAPEVVWQAFLKSVRRITDEQSSPQAIILSSAMHSLIPVDINGNALANMITWADNRSGAIARKLKDSSTAEMLYEQTGTPIHAMSPLCKVMWMKEYQPALFQATGKFISIKEYIWHRMFNSFQADFSVASATGLMDIYSLSWSENAMDIAALTEERLPSLVAPEFCRGDCSPEVASSMGIDKNTKIIIGASDGCLANLGSFATRPGIAALTIGTSGAVRVASRDPVHHFPGMIFNYRLDRDTFICGGPSNNGGAALRWYIENFLHKPLETIEHYNAVLSTLSDSKPGAGDLMFLPYLYGERAPVWNSDASAVFFGVRATHNQAHFTRAVVEGISMAMCDIADNMMQAGLAIDSVHVSGGFVRSSAWLQLLANIFNKKISLLYADDASATGAGYLGLKSLGVISDYELLRPKVTTEFLPQPEYIEVYQRQFRRYRELYRNVEGMMVP